MNPDHIFDVDRLERIGLGEALYCSSKSPSQVEAAVNELAHQGVRVLLTRLPESTYARLGATVQQLLDYDPLSCTAVMGPPLEVSGPARVGIVTAGTSDLLVAREAARTLMFYGEPAEIMADLGVAGLWRVLERRTRLSAFAVLIAVAGMEGAFFSVLGGLVGNPIIAVPTSTGYGVTAGGQTALHSALGSCAPGIVAVNIDNGFGAACAALRMLGHGRRGSKGANDHVPGME
jgi:pyridinium-3,5-biscarboxylic acid mononucleotide synthase